MARKTIEQIRAELDELNQKMAKKQKASDVQIISMTRTNQEKAKKQSFKERMSISKTGVKRPDMLGDNNIAKTSEERKRRSELMKGVPKTKESRDKFKETYKNLVMIVCPHCGFQSKNQGNMNRYHFHNCKHK